jgi:hypothetical protein
MTLSKEIRESASSVHETPAVLPIASCYPTNMSDYEPRGADQCINIYVQSSIPPIKEHREKAAARVRTYFERNFPLPSQRTVLCYLAEDNSLQRLFGPENRGFHYPVGKGLAGWWPEDVRNFTALVSAHSLVYLHGSTCESELALTMTLAHELEHFLQYSERPNLWAADSLLQKLVPNVGLQAGWETPAEMQARIVSKKVATDLYGPDQVAAYIAERIEGARSSRDRESWESLQSLDARTDYDMAAETESLIRHYRQELKRIQALPESVSLPGAALDLEPA